MNREVNIECANEITGAFYECIVAPSFSDEAKEILAAKKNLRLLELDIDNSLINNRKLDLYSSFSKNFLNKKKNP